MDRVFKTLLLWLILAALPLQGVASVVKATCGAKHHPMMVAGSPDNHHHDHSDARHHHGHENDHSAAAHDGPGLEPDADVVAKASTCSACAACCVGATAPPTRLNLTPVLAVSASIVIAPALAFIGHIPAGPERPPQYSLA
jgi:hypothetical protein